METAAERATCHAKGCSEPATALCDRCGHSFCQTHLRPLVIQRRTERSKHYVLPDTLARLPTRSETYVLCSRCRSKPVPP